MKTVLFYFAFLMFFAKCEGLFSQTVSDSTKITLTIPKKKSSIFKGRPGKAMLYSLIIPGTGQLYNKSYLRVPFVWGAVGFAGYTVVHNTRDYNCLRDAYIAKIDGTSYIPVHCSQDLKTKLPLISNASTIRAIRDEVNKNRQISIVAFSFVWLLNGIDAFVDAHLKDFDMDDDLSFSIDTRVDNDPFAPMKMGLYVQF